MIADRVLDPADERERKRFLKHAIRFVVKDKAEGERVVLDLRKQFPSIKTLVLDDTCVAYQPPYNERVFVAIFLTGWFVGRDRVFICE